MSIRAFTGGAGCGKTYQLMAALRDQLAASPLKEGQRVLALTFMHGSRRRLQERLGELESLGGRAECATIDSFALRLVRRWRTLAGDLGYLNVEPEQYDQVCDAASMLVEVAEVRNWVAAAYPVMLVDEAQDMSLNRLRLVKGLSERLDVLAAADEFQCLDERLQPNPACAWLRDECECEDLTRPRRSNVTELLDAAAAIRTGSPPLSGTYFKVHHTPNAALAGSWINNNLRWYCGGKRVAIIAPVFAQFAKAALSWASQNRTANGSGPYTISVEESEGKAAQSFSASLPLENLNTVAAVSDMLEAAADLYVAREMTEWMSMQRRAQSRITFTKKEILRAVTQVFAQRRRFDRGGDQGWKAMTVHGAKNREFDNVIVLWPAAVAGGEDMRRRLLYNAVTRAKSRCLVLVQATAQLSRAPFA